MSIDCIKKEDAILKTRLLSLKEIKKPVMEKELELRVDIAYI